MAGQPDLEAAILGDAAKQAAMVEGESSSADSALGQRPDAEEEDVGEWYREQWKHIDNRPHHNIWESDAFPYMQRHFSRDQSVSMRKWLTRHVKAVPRPSPVLFVNRGGRSTTVRLGDEDHMPNLGALLGEEASSEPTVMVLSDLEPAAMEMLGSQLHIPPAVFLKHISTNHNIWGVQYASGAQAHDIDLLSIKQTLSIAFDSEIWARCPGTASYTDAYERSSLGKVAWPRELSPATAALGSILYDIRAISSTTFHCWQDAYGTSHLLVLMTPWSRLMMRSPLHQSRVPSHVGYEPDEWSEFILHTDGDPFLDSDEALLDPASGRVLQASHERALARFCADLSHAISTPASLETPLLTRVLDFAWTVLRPKFDILLQRRKKRLEYFSRHTGTLRALDKVGLYSKSPINFFERCLLDQFSVLDMFAEHFEEQDARGSRDQQHRQVSCLMKRVQNLSDRCRDERNKLMQRQQRQLTEAQLEESRKSIEQTDQVRKLTILAFVFIPISAVTSAFGMNLVEISNRQPGVGTFVAAVAVVTAVTILFALAPSLQSLDLGIQHKMRLPWQRSSAWKAWPPVVALGRLLFDRRLLLYLYVYVLTGPARLLLHALATTKAALAALQRLGTYEAGRRTKQQQRRRQQREQEEQQTRVTASGGGAGPGVVVVATAGAKDAG